MKINPSSLWIMLLLSTCTLTLHAQQDKESIKEHRQEINDRALKDARIEAKSMKQDGWYTQPGAMPLEKQIERAWMKEVETDDQGRSKYFTGIGNAVEKTQDEAKKRAFDIAKGNLTEQICSKLTRDIETNITALQVANDDTANIQSAVSTTKEIIPQKLTKTITLMEIYKKQGENFECQIRIAYSQELVRATVKQTVLESLQEASNLTSDKLDQLIGF